MVNDKDTDVVMRLLPDSPKYHYIFTRPNTQRARSAEEMLALWGEEGIAIVYQATDSVPDIYLRALDMSGQFDNSRSASLNTGYKIPNKVKIVCDRNAQKMDDFAVLWTELNNVYRGDDGTESYTENICNMLNASRVHISNTLHLTDPITVGGEQDSLTVMGDSDATLIVPHGKEDEVRRTICLDSFVYAPVSEDEALGHIDYTLDGRLLKSTALRATEDVPRQKIKHKLLRRIKESFTYG